MSVSEPKNDVWTVRRILGWTTGYLESKGCDTPRLDAEILLGHSLKMSRVQLYLNFDRPLSNDERDSYRELVSRRARREPVSLITGKKEFWSIPIMVEAGVLIPRPDTETLVEVVLNELIRYRNPCALEIGVGSGAVAAAIMVENKSVTIVGTDTNKQAALLSRKNAFANGCSDRFMPVIADLASPFGEGPLFHIIFSNPPYVPTESILSLAPEIGRFEPLSALDGGKDGLDYYRRIVHEASRFLAHDGRLVLEIGDGQAQSVQSILENEGLYSDITFHRDLTGAIRVIKASVR